MSAELVTFPKGKLTDIPEMLRRLADQIERGDYKGITGAAIVLEAPKMPVFGYGSCDPVNMSELFACAHLKMSSERLNHLMEL